MERLLDMHWGVNGQSIVPAYDDRTTLYVPPTEIWLVTAAAINLDATCTPTHFSLLIQHADPTGNSGGWMFALTATETLKQLNPPLGLEREIVLAPGQRLTARASWASSEPCKMCLMLSGFKFPYSPERLEALVMRGSTVHVSPVPSGFQAAVTGAQAALTALAESVG